MESILISCGVCGLLIGSFLNVCIYRVPRKLSVLRPYRSFCPQCENPIAAWQNIPVLSWLLLRGRCHSCKKPISGQYPLVELLSATAALASCIQFGFTLTSLIVYLLCAALIVITFIDFEFKIIPNVISFPGMIFGLLLGILFSIHWLVWFSDHTKCYRLPVWLYSWRRIFLRDWYDLLPRVKKSWLGRRRYKAFSNDWCNHGGIFCRSNYFCWLLNWSSCGSNYDFNQWRGETYRNSFRALAFAWRNNLYFCRSSIL